jgi:hypothetical protein
VAPDEGPELGRFVLLDDVPFNGESWALARIFDALRTVRPRWRAIVSKADPLRIDDPLTGRVVKPEHWGQIYQASNAAYVGASRPRTVWIGTGNHVFSERVLCKIRSNERGAAGAARRLVALGVPPRHPGEDPGAWLDRVLRHPLFRTARHPGTLTYVFGLWLWFRIAQV